MKKSNNYLKRKACSLSLLTLLIFANLLATDLFAQNFPFPHQINYDYGIKPTSQSQTTLNADMQSKFEAWRPVYLTSAGCPPNAKRVVAINQNNETFSEGISYGMTILVYMDNAINNTRADFDALFRYYDYYLNDKGLMKWKISADGTPVDEGFAGDGDEEVAFALIMADKQWGSNGTIDYLNEAKRIIQALKTYNVQPNSVFADGTGWWIFPAYQIPYQWKEFAAVTNDNSWVNTIAAGYSFLNKFYLNNTGLMYDTSTPDGNAVDSDHNTYGYDACRVPWRIATDYLWNGTSNSNLAKDHPAKIANWAKTKWNSNPQNAVAKYAIDGTGVVSYCNYGNMVTPMAVGAMAGADQQWLNTLYDFSRNISIGNNYFADNVCLMSMLVLTGNMPNFRTAPVGDDIIPPSVPTGLVSSQITSNGFTLAWNASNDNIAVTGYEVYKDGNMIGTSSSNSFNVTDLLPSSTYSITVKAFDAAGNKSSESLALLVTTQASSSFGELVTVRARLIYGTSDNIVLRYDNIDVKTWTISSTFFSDYTFAINESHNVKLFFPDNGTDMEVDFLQIGTTKYEAENQAINTSVWQNGSCGGSYSQIMNCSGYIDFGFIAGEPIGQNPYSGFATDLPGTLEVEHYDNGGMNVAYYDTDAGNNGNSTLRNDDVDIKDIGGGNHTIGWNSSGEWHEYTVNLPNGTYNISTRAASNDGAGKQMTLKLGDSPDGTSFQTLTSISIPNTGDWNTFQEITVNNVTVSNGGNNKVLRIETTTGYFDADWIRFSLVDEPGEENYIIYNDALQNDWYSGGWGSIIDIANASPVASGSNSTLVEYTGAWGAWVLANNTAKSTAGFGSIKFKAYGAGTGNTIQVVVKASVGGAETGRLQGIQIEPNLWKEYTVLFSEIGNPLTIGEIWIHDVTGAPQNAFYVDDIMFSISTQKSALLLDDHSSLANLNVQVYPNPVQNVLTISNIEVNSTVSVFASDGSKKLLLNAANESLKIDVSNWNKGLYLIRIQNSNGIVTNKILIK